MKKISRILVYILCFVLIFGTCVFAEEMPEGDFAESKTEAVSEPEAAQENLAETAAEAGSSGENSSETTAQDPESSSDPGNKEQTTDPEQDPAAPVSDPEAQTAADSKDPATGDSSAAAKDEEEAELKKTDTKAEGAETNTEESEAKKTEEEKKEEEDKTEDLKKASAAVGTIGIVVKNANTGRYTFSLTGLENEANLTGVKFAIWCASDQSDLRWYTGERQSSGAYWVTMFKYLHKDHTGLYFAHVYATYKDGSERFVAGTTFMINSTAPVVTAAKTSEKYHFEANYIPQASEISYVRFGVWSNNGGQDDLRWYTASYYSQKTVKASLDVDLSKHSDGGLYYVKAIGCNLSGKQIEIGTTSFNVIKEGVLSCSRIESSVNKNNGAFAIYVNDVYSPNGIKSIKVAVWSKSDQSDLVWYPMKNLGENRYGASSKISFHNYNLGLYNAHVYLEDNNGVSKYLIGRSFAVKASAGAASVENSTDERYYPMSIRSVVIPAGIKGVQFAVWSDASGQDDLVWYNGTAQGAGNYTATADIQKHKTAGFYNVHIYGITMSGASVFLGNTGFTVAPTAEVTVTNSGLTDSDSRFQAAFSITRASSPVTNVKMCVWCKSDKSDLFWYRPVQNAQGQFVINIHTINHYGNVGTYHIDTYAAFSNGIEMCVSSITQWFKPRAYLLVSKSDGTATRKLYYVNTGVPGVSFRVSTQRGGQSDQKTYSAKQMSNGSYYTTMSMADFEYDGQYNVEVLSNGNVVETGSFIMLDYLEEGYKMALNDNIGYSQIHRTLNPDVDCSSFVYYSLKNTGYNVPGGWPMTTYSEESVLKGAGFSMFTFTNASDLQPGDILLRAEHTEIYAGNGRTVGAHLDENGDILGTQMGDQTKNEVSEVIMSTNWRYVFRYIEYPM